MRVAQKQHCHRIGQAHIGLDGRYIIGLFGSIFGALFGSEAPDSSVQREIAAGNQALGKEQLDFAKQQYADQAGARADATAAALRQSDSATRLADQNAQIAADAAARMKTVQNPLEDRIIADAEGFNTDARREDAASKAGADVSSQFQAAQEAQARQQASMGVNPNSGRALAASNGNSVALAAARVGAANKARDGVETQGWARRMDAASLGRNLASNQATSAGLALNAGQAAAAASTMPMTIAQQGAGVLNQGYGSAIQANNSAAGIYNQASAADMAATGQTADFIGGSSAMAAKYFSDENMKSDVEPVKEGETIKAIRKTGVSKWRYDPSLGGPDEGGKQRTGPMAQDVQKNFGDTAAPGGQMIDGQEMHGIAMAGLKDVDANMQKLTKQVSSLQRRVARMGVSKGTAA